MKSLGHIHTQVDNLQMVIRAVKLDCVGCAENLKFVAQSLTMSMQLLIFILSLPSSRVLSLGGKTKMAAGFAITSGGQQYNGKITWILVLSSMVAATGALSSAMILEYQVTLVTSSS